jgi:competence ComEA-like helix-hairpin-helix protein
MKMTEESSNNVKLNYCSSTDLMQFSGIGRKRADSIIQYRRKHGQFLTIEYLDQVPGLALRIVESIINQLDWSFNGHYVPLPKVLQADARHLHSIPTESVDLIVTSPPYWKKRDYKHPQQIGQEETPEEYIDTLIDTIDSWVPFLRPHATVFLNIGDTYRDGTLVGIPDLLGVALRRHEWLVVNRIIWAKPNGVPEPLPYRLASRHEIIFQITRNREYFSDVNSLAQALNQSANPGDVWNIPHSRNMSNHLAPFPEELVNRIIEFACPEHVCSKCGKPYTRNLRSTADLDQTRPQARRAIELFEQAGLTDEHLRAIRAVGISDAGKGQRIQTGADGNAKRTRELAQEAKQVLGGYFREFTFAPKRRLDWTICPCRAPALPGTVLDPFMGSGTSVRVAYQLGRIAIGADLVPPESIFS